MKTKATKTIFTTLLVLGLVLIVNASFLSSESKMETYLEVETEESLVMEDWMVNEAYFVSSIEIEKALEVEDWMLDEKNFQ